MVFPGAKISMKEMRAKFVGYPTRGTLATWRDRGLLGPDGETRVKLKMRKDGGMWYTTQQWIDEFTAGLNGELLEPQGRG